MNPVICDCPICNNKLSVTQLSCPNCETRIEGSFSLGKLYQLSAEQLAFIELFVCCEGKITRMEEKLGLSYPAVRARLSDIVSVLRCNETADNSVEETEAPSNKSILDAVASGEISAEDALNLISE